MARIRSPNFPGIPLEDAVNFVSAIFDKNRQAVIMREDAAKDIGYTGLTGRSLKVLGALNQYDLIENVSNGQLKVTDTARDILHGFPEETRMAALHRAGNAPALFSSIYERFDGDIPGENAVRSFLIQKGFTNQGVEKALKSFLGTNRYLEIKGASENRHSETAPNDQSDRDDQIERRRAASRPEHPSGSEDVEQAKPSAVFWAAKGPLDFNLSSSGLAVTGETNSAADLRSFIGKLQALVALLPEGTGEGSKRDNEMDDEIS